MRRRGILLLATMAVALLLACAAALAADAQDYQAQVVGGTEVPNGKYRFVAALLDERRLGNDDRDKQFCGGTLIDRNSVLTAAHCVVEQGNVMPTAPLRVTAGRTLLNSDQGQKRHVSKIFVHPRYNANAHAHDAAVLKLSRAVSGIAPIERAAPSQDYLEKPGRYATIAGWGNTIKQTAPLYLEPNSYPNRMHEARVPLVSDADAKRAYSRSYVKELMVAAGKEGKDTCQGDSGGPMFAKIPSGPRQIGITSFGAGCGARGYPGVYTEVNAAPIRSFITDAASR